MKREYKLCLVLAAIIMLAVAAVAAYSLAPAGRAVDVPDEGYIEQLEATYGPFDEICLFRYYPLENPGIPGRCSYGGRAWKLEEIVEYGDRWEARYVSDD